MSTKYPGGIITKNYVAPTPSSASGIWTLDQQEQAQKAGIWPFGGPFNYIEDVFSTYLYTGNGTTQTITNNIDLSTKGGMVWQKDRTTAGTDGVVCDTARGVNAFLRTSGTYASVNNGGTDAVYAYNSNGFSTGTTNGFNINLSGDATVSWTFRKQPKFFDIVTYTGNGSSTQVINHSLGSRPGAIFFKKTSATSNWVTYNRLDATNTCAMFLNKTDASLGISSSWMTSTNFTAYQLGADTGFAADNMNDNGATYVAYLFAHDAGGFGTTNTDNVISCGSFSTGAGGGATVTLGYEPQWLMIKSSSNASAWYTFDSMRGWIIRGSSRGLSPNTANAEFNFGSSSLPTNPTATGFTITDGLLPASETWIYIAIRRGPMKVPTTGTSVFGDISALEPVSTNQTTENGVLADLVINGLRINQGGFGPHWLSRLTGDGVSLVSSSTAAEFNPGDFWKFDNNNFAYISPNGYANNDGTKKYLAYSFKRAPGFFDVVCYTGTGVARTVSHNLAAVPELMIVKRRDLANNWAVYAAPLGNTNRVFINQTQASAADSTLWNDTTPTSSVFTVGTAFATNNSGNTFVAYLFATCAGVSKVGSYTGNGTTQTIDCGFGAGGARFVLIKRTDSTGDWYVWDTARGMVAGTDPSLLLNSTAAEVNANSIYTIATGFQIVSTAAGINATGGTYIFLAIA